MADSEVIKHDQIIEDDVFKNAATSADVLLAKMDALISSFKELIKITGKKIPLTDPKTLTEAEQIAAALKKITDAEKGISAIQKVKIQAQAIINKQNTDYKNQLKAEESAYQKLSIQLINQKKIVKDLIVSKKELTEADKKLIKETKELDKYLKDVDDSLGDHGRHVGGYREILNDASAELGSFGGGLKKVINSLKLLQEENSKATTGTQKFGNVLKFAGAGAALIAITAIVKGLELFKEASGTASDNWETFTEKMKGNLTSLIALNFQFGKNNAMTELWMETLHKSQDTVRVLGIEMEKLTIKFEEQNQIASDSTIGYNERIEAQKKSIELSKQMADNAIASAQSEKNAVDDEVLRMEVILKGGKVSTELLNKQAESTKKLMKAEGDRDLLKLTNASKIRQINIDETDDLIQLTLSSKLSAQSRKTILEDEIKDQQNYISKRRASNEQLFNENNAIVQKELEIFKGGRKIQEIGHKITINGKKQEFTLNSLLIEQDQVMLANKLKAIKTDESHGLDPAGITELAKIVKQSQESEMFNMKIINDLAKEEMKNLERISEINREISLMKVSDEAHDSSIVAKQRIDTYEETNKKIFEGQNIWDFKMQRLRQRQYDLILSQEENSLELQKEILEQKEKDAEIKANNTITDTKVLNAEILKLQTQLYIDLGNLETEKNLKDKERDKKKAEDDKKLRNARIDAEFKTIGQITDGISDGLQKQSEIRQMADQKEIDMHQRMLEVQMGLAAAGSDNVLAETLAQTAKAEEKKLQDAKKAAKRQEDLALIQTFTSTLQAALKADKPFLQAFGEALASEGLVQATFSKLFAGSAYEGTEDTGGAGNLDEKGGKAWILHPHERVLSKEQNEKLGGISNEELVRAVNPDLSTTFYPKITDTQISHDQYYANSRLISEMKNEITAMRQSFEKRPVQNTNLNGLGEWTEKITEQNMSTIIHHKKNNSRRPSLRMNG